MLNKFTANSFFTILTTTLILFGGGLWLYSCGKAEKPAEEAAVPKEKALEPIKLAVAGPHSGDLASYGIPSIRAAELIVAHRNALYGVNGRKIELIVEDDVCKPEVATNTATKLVSEKAHVVLGHICSGATKAALGIYKYSKIITMSP